MIFMKKDKLENFLKKNGFFILLAILLLIGCSVRIIGIDLVPAGLNQDEASAGYEAYSLMEYGIDRNGNSFPIHFVAWGSGQNSLYSYLMIPFIKLLGLTSLAVRLPMAIIGCITLFVMTYLIYQMSDKNKKATLIATVFLVICPWHIMKSRWGLESNLFPDLVLYAVALLLLGLKKQKKSRIYFAFVLFGISCYSYGTSYFFMPLFLMSLLVFLVYQKKLTLKQACCSLGIVFVIVLPLLIFVVINTFDLPQIKFFNITIPRLVQNRYETISSVFSSDFLSKSWSNFTGGIKLFLFQKENLPWNVMEGYGLIYLFSFPFTLIGLIHSFRKSKEWNNLNVIFNFWFIAAFLLLFVCEPNVNRLNIMLFPFIYDTIVGIYCVMNRVKYVSVIIAILYTCFFYRFFYHYLAFYQKQLPSFETSLKEVVSYISQKEIDKVYVTDSINQPYIYFLFYTKQDPREFKQSMIYEPNGEKVKSYGKYVFSLPEEIKPERKTIYVVPKMQGEIEKKDFDVTEIGKYLVLEAKEEE